MGAMPAKFLLGLALYGFLMQAVQIPPTADLGSALSVAEHLTLTGALILAVAILWKSLLKKEELLVKSTEVVTAALSTATAANIELRKTVEDLRDVIEGGVRK